MNDNSDAPDNARQNLPQIENLAVTVGMEPLPVLLPIVLLQPEKVRFILTDSSGPVKERAVQLANQLECSSHHGSLQVEGNDPQAIKDALSERWNDWGAWHLAYTGGTKAMSVAASVLIRDTARLWYVDEPRQRLITHERVASYQDLQISLDQLVELHGFTPDHNPANPGGNLANPEIQQAICGIATSLSGVFDEITGRLVPTAPGLDLFARRGTRIVTASIRVNDRSATEVMELKNWMMTARAIAKGLGGREAAAMVIVCTNDPELQKTVQRANATFSDFLDDNDPVSLPHARCFINDDHLANSVKTWLDSLDNPAAAATSAGGQPGNGAQPSLGTQPSESEAADGDGPLLVCTVGESPLPVVLAAATLEPSRLHLITSPRTTSLVEPITGSLRALGLNVQRVTEQTVDPYDPSGVIQAVDAAVNGTQQAQLAYTGGTKVMAVHAALAAQWSALWYVDDETLTLKKLVP